MMRWRTIDQRFEQKRKVCYRLREWRLLEVVVAAAAVVVVAAVAAVDYLEGIWLKARPGLQATRRPVCGWLAVPEAAAALAVEAGLEERRYYQRTFLPCLSLAPQRWCWSHPRRQMVVEWASHFASEPT